MSNQEKTQVADAILKAAGYRRDGRPRGSVEYGQTILNRRMRPCIPPKK